MSTIARRAFSARTFVPPKIASPQAIGAPKDALRMSRIVDFYSKLPAGPAPKQQVPNNVFAAYKHKYFDGDNASGVPLLHLIGFVMFGYTCDYFWHLQYHKSGVHA
ncbi:hypothetical protein SAICODRAFT_220400 [Saitoella complicata NRRL Y-17804]|uniref:uncharacterized protein n=1 Tax=Saitoella complicata (strain BCRC 22490 / CBS 7301 / JCM 7358 / NBRC 10748 / NRRL Y-17804) TaxID=698492 RepID=UPI00086799F1|nr:uncharacterized protein SAICODRAFT_220400 [Saitoella complicata NRRL Y-17804]ODQ53980.1 hypothetical protein SAICODRAFT_220400 [Saitoella complicata NRRL Y-17804]